MLRPPFARVPFRRFSAVVPFGSHFHLLRDCFRPPFPRSFGGAELAVTCSSTPQASCIQGCRYSAALLYACRGRLWCGYIYVVRVAAKYDWDCGCYSMTKPAFRKGWFSNTSFTTGLKTLPTCRPDTLVFFLL